MGFSWNAHRAMTPGTVYAPSFVRLTRFVWTRCSPRAILWLLVVLWTTLELSGCLVTTADCDENNPCNAGFRCFRSRVVNGGYCHRICVDDGGCNAGEVCRLCQGLCLGTSPAETEGLVCAPCQCDPRCLDSEGCMDGICTTEVVGCQCRGEVCQ